MTIKTTDLSNGKVSFKWQTIAVLISTVITVTAFILGIYYSLDKRVTVLETQLPIIVKQIDGNLSDLKKTVYDYVNEQKQERKQQRRSNDK